MEFFFVVVSSVWCVLYGVLFVWCFCCMVFCLNGVFGIWCLRMVFLYKVVFVWCLFCMVFSYGVFVYCIRVVLSYDVLTRCFIRAFV